MTRKIIQEIIFIVLRVAFIVALIFIGYSMISKCYDFGYKIFADEAKDPAPGITKTVAIVDGKTNKEIGLQRYVKARCIRPLNSYDTL